MISISFDLWTLPNGHAIVGVVGHFINKDGRRRQVVLGLREIVGEYTGENMAGVLIDLFRDYGIAGSIGYFIADNAESNDTCIDAVLRALCAQAFIIGSDAEGVCKELATAYREMDFKKVEDLWRKRGAVGLLHNLVRYIRMTP